MPRRSLLALPLLSAPAENVLALPPPLSAKRALRIGVATDAAAGSAVR